MSYSSIITNFKACMTDIGNALRTVLGTTKTYKLTEVADAIRTGCQTYYLGQGTSFNVSSIPGYKNLTADNFVIEPITQSNYYEYSQYYGTKVRNTIACSFSKAYNASTGVFSCSATVNCTYNYDQSAGDDNPDNVTKRNSFSIPVKAYLIVGSKKSI